MKNKVTYILTILAFLVVVVAILLVIWRQPHRDAQVTKEPQNQTTRTVSDEQPEWIEVEIRRIEPTIDVSGRLRSGKRLEIFPEVPGTAVFASSPFREGVSFQKGEVLMQLDREEAVWELRAARSSFRTLVASALPDVRLDYPEQHEIFEDWYSSIDPDTLLPEIPIAENAALTRFLASRNVFERYYQIRSAERRLDKFTIRAPFDGVVSVSKVEPGQSVMPQQHLGTLVHADRFIMTATIPHSAKDLLAKGQTVRLTGQNGNSSWTGTVERINPSVDVRTQRIPVYLQVSGPGLGEGQYLEGTLKTGRFIEVAEIPLGALHRGGHVYVLDGQKMVRQPVQVHDLARDYVLVTGLQDGQRIVADYRRAMNRQVSG